MARRFNKEAGFISFLLPLAGAIFVVAGLTIGIMNVGFNMLSYALMGVGLVLFVSIFFRAERANLLYYLHVTFYSLLVTCICVGLFLFARQYDKEFDLTAGKMHSLSMATVNYLKRLDAPVTITVFSPDGKSTFPVGQRFFDFKPVMDLYNRHTDKLNWNFFDPVKSPIEAKKFGERVTVGEIYVEAGTNKQRLSIAELPPEFSQRPVVAENTLTNAIMQATRKSRPKVYFLTGHGEVSFSRPVQPPQQQQMSPVPNSVQVLVDALKGRGIDSAELDLARQGSIPADAEVLVIAGPKRDLFQTELTRIREWLQAGGKLLLMFDAQVSAMASPQENIKELLTQYGIEAPDDIIFDGLGVQFGYGDPVYPFMMNFDTNHPITKLLAAGDRSAVPPPARPLVKGNVPPDMQYTELVKSSPASWTVQVRQLAENMPPPSKNQLQPVTFGVAVGKTPPPQVPGIATPAESKNNTRLVVYGTSALPTDSYLPGNNTAILLMFNTMDWLTESEDMIAIPPRQAKGTPIILDENQIRLVFILSVILVPSVLFFGGLSYTIIRRRR